MGATSHEPQMCLVANAAGALWPSNLAETMTQPESLDTTLAVQRSRGGLCQVPAELSNRSYRSDPGGPWWAGASHRRRHRRRHRHFRTACHDRGAHIIAVEPGDGMRNAAAPHDNVSWVAGRAEATGLRAQAVDAVLCAQSFHWFSPPVVLPELARILKPGGRLGIMWNRRSQTNPLSCRVPSGNPRRGRRNGCERVDFNPGVVAETGFFSPPDRHAFPNVQRLTLEGLIGRARSASYVPKTGEEGRRLLEACARSTHSTPMPTAS